MKRVVNVGDASRRCVHGIALETECVGCNGILASSATLNRLREIIETFTSGYCALLNDLSNDVNKNTARRAGKRT